MSSDSFDGGCEAETDGSSLDYLHNVESLWILCKLTYLHKICSCSASSDFLILFSILKNTTQQILVLHF